MTNSFRAVLQKLRSSGRVLTVAEPVDPLREVIATAEKVFQETGRYALFKNLEGAPGWQAFGNATIPRDLWADAFAITNDNLVSELVSRMRNGVGEVLVVNSSDAPILEVQEPPGMPSLPAPMRAEGDGGSVLCAVLVSAIDNCTRLCLVDVLVEGESFSIVGLPEKFIPLPSERRRCGLVFGGELAIYLAAELGRSEEVDYGLVSKLNGLPFCTTEVNGLSIPANAECCLVGELLGKRYKTGPISNDIGTYSQQLAVEFNSNTFYRRAGPIFPLVDRAAGPTLLATELQVWRHIVNIEGGLDLLDICCDASAFGLVATVKLRPRLIGQAKTALLGALSGSADRVKMAIGVDDDVDVCRILDVLWSFASRTHAAHDLEILESLSMIESDPTARDDSGAATTAKWLVDSTMPPVSQPEARSEYQRAVPKNLESVRLSEFENP
jgi:3-polyprenyl-4-hydroxybenzoate decarboxylase